MPDIKLSPKFGVNPSIERCFYCGADKGLILFGRLRGDVEAPKAAAFNYEPCNDCAQYMQQGVILISVTDASTNDQDACRTGGWVVVTDAFIRRVVPPDMQTHILKRRMAFVPDETWDLFGLPRPTAEKTSDDERAD